MAFVSCASCQEELPSTELEEHLRRHLRYGRLECLLCGLSFFSRLSAQLHFSSALSEHPGKKASFAENKDPELEDKLFSLLLQSNRLRDECPVTSKQNEENMEVQYSSEEEPDSSFEVTGLPDVTEPESLPEPVPDETADRKDEHTINVVSEGVIAKYTPEDNLVVLPMPANPAEHMNVSSFSSLLSDTNMKTTDEEESIEFSENALNTASLYKSFQNPTGFKTNVSPSDIPLGRFKCTACDGIFANNYLIRHVTSQHMSLPIWKCKLCPYFIMRWHHSANMHYGHLSRKHQIPKNIGWVTHYEDCREQVSDLVIAKLKECFPNKLYLKSSLLNESETPERKAKLQSKKPDSRDREPRSRHSDKEHHIKKPLNAFMLFMKENRAKMQEQKGFKERQSAELNKEMGRMWHLLSQEEQQKYYQMAEEERQRHQQQFPGWSARDNNAIYKKRKLDKIQDDPDSLELKKCRARFGLDNQAKWCKHCKRKKKCLWFREGPHYGHHGEQSPAQVSSTTQGSPQESETSTTSSLAHFSASAALHLHKLPGKPPSKLPRLTSPSSVVSSTNHNNSSGNSELDSEVSDDSGDEDSEDEDLSAPSPPPDLLNNTKPPPLHARPLQLHLAQA